MESKIEMKSNASNQLIISAHFELKIVCIFHNQHQGVLLLL